MFKEGLAFFFYFPNPGVQRPALVPGIKLTHSLISFCKSAVKHHCPRADQRRSSTIVAPEGIHYFYTANSGYPNPNPLL